MHPKLTTTTLLLRPFLIFFTAFFVLNAAAVIELVEFESEVDEARYRSLIHELRCLVCQNQNLADSDADLAKDLRRITADKIRQGQTDEQIKAFMIERYGEFVLYEPPVKGTTLILWLAPFFILLIAAVILLRLSRKTSDVDTNIDHDKIRSILNDDD